MRRMMLIAFTFVVISLLGTASAGAVVIDMGASGRYGVALVPGTRSTLTTAGVTTVNAGAPCTDPWLASDFILQSSGLCYNGGPVMHANETFAVTWDPHRLDWQVTRNYVEQFLKDVADGSSWPNKLASLSSQYSLTSQYRDAGGRASYTSAYGGGCVDFGQPGGSTCKFASAVATGRGHNDLGSDCPVSGTNYFWQDPSGAWGPNANAYCITDDQIRTEVSQMVSEMGLIGRTQSELHAADHPPDAARRRRLPGRRGQDLLGERRLHRPVLLLPQPGERRRHLGVVRRSAVDRKNTLR